MEYLMTYGWAILVIAVVLGVLFQLGVFGGANLAPRAQAGSCQVQRTAAGISLEGMCQGEMPQYVATFGGGSSTDIQVSSPSSFTAQNLTVAVWVYPTTFSFPCCSRGKVAGNNFGGNNDFYVDINSGAYPEAYVYTTSWHNLPTTGVVLSTNTWYFVAETYNGFYQSIYFDGAYNNGGACACGNLPSPQGTLGIGGGGGDSPFVGDIANLQLYNTTLSAAEIKALYQEGIGGAPVRPQSIIGWWPLNGGTNDYSGGNNDGQNNGAGYTSFWTNGYSAP